MTATKPRTQRSHRTDPVTRDVSRRRGTRRRADADLSSAGGVVLPSRPATQLVAAAPNPPVATTTQPTGRRPNFTG
jgi:hypothetical protein